MTTRTTAILFGLICISPAIVHAGGNSVPFAAEPIPRISSGAGSPARRVSLPTEASADWWSQVRRNIRLEEYAVVRSAAGGRDDYGEAIEAPNPAQRFRTTFRAGGIEIHPLEGEQPAWQWGLSLVSWGRPGRPYSSRSVAGTVLRSERNRIELVRAGLTEWYANSPDGLEHGFTIPAPPMEAGDGLALDLRLSGSLTPQFSQDGQAIDFFDSGSVGIIRYDHLIVTDATGAQLASRFEPVPSGIRIAVDDRTAVYPVTVDPLATSPAWTGSGDENGAYFGYSVATAGDVNGDGYSDVIVGAYLDDAGAGTDADRGQAYVYLGSAEGLATIAAWTGSGDEGGAYFGHSVATAGDVNRDGYSDVIVGAYGHDAGAGAAADRGQVYLYLGSAAGLATGAAWTASGDENSARFGNSVATAGDVNGDDYSDVIVGAYGHDTGAGGNERGRAYLYLGSAAGLASSTAWIGSGDENAAHFGHSVATAGDVNADGYSDVIVGAYSHDVGAGTGANRGRAYLYAGSAAGLATSPAWTASGDQNWARFGYSVATAGDVNGDGYSDVMVGADVDYEWGAYLYLGSTTGLATSPAWTAAGDDGGDHFGSSVATAGDVNGDGFSDVIVGAYGHDAGAGAGAGRGRAYLYFGSAAGLGRSDKWIGSGNQNDARFGYSVATAGDVNGDGYSDVIVGAPLQDSGVGAGVNRGRAYLYLGSASRLNLAWTGLGDEDEFSFGSAVATAGDVNGDGYSDVIVGANYYDYLFGSASRGRTYLYMGSAAGLGTSAAWTASGDEYGAHFGASVATAGDVNGDGYSDVIVGAPLQDSGAGTGANRGRAYLYLGSAAGLGTNAAWTAAGDEGGALFGVSVATAGDVNGDSYSDVIVGAYGYHAGASQYVGRTYLYLGSAAGLATSAAWTASGDDDSALFGVSVATAGDVNGDGYSDVIIGAYGHDAGAGEYASRGRAYLYLGSAAGLAADAAWIGSGDENRSYFGISVATAGDVNGDRYSDVIVGAHGHDAGGGGNADRGRVYVYLGSATGLAASATWVVSGDETGANFGDSVASAGDVNGDGYSDVIAGAYGHNGGGVVRGRAYMYLGSAAGLATSAAWTESGDENMAFFGTSVATAGDVNGDGYSDVVVGAPGGVPVRGQAYLFLGSAGDAFPCGGDARELCLSGGRFAVTARWTAGGQSGDGMPVPLSADTGYFWFFAATNVEMVVKVLNACSLSGHYWVFAGGLTDVLVDMTVRDTETGEVRTYHNPQGTAFQPIQDTSAFATCP